MNNEIKTGDLIEFVDNSKIIIGINKNGNGLTIEEIENKYDVKIKKVVRPIGYKQIYEKKEILDEAEKRYLEAVIRPFKEDVRAISKRQNPFIYSSDCKDYYINIVLDDCDEFSLPYFKNREMYKGMETNKYYTIEELGLYE